MKKHLSYLASFVIILLVCGVTSSHAAKRKAHTPKSQPAATAEEQVPKASNHGMQGLSKSPYAGAIAIDAATGKVLFEDNADTKGYPASITKLMNLLVLIEAIESKRLNLDDQVTITAESSKIGGSQVFLKENEVFPVNELIYALIVQSANDAATALAIHFAGSKEAFVDLMNKRAQEIGMKDTTYHSVHGLPPGKDQLPDVSTPRDLAKLCQELLKHPATLEYTATKERPFRPDSAEPFIMRSHNHLLGSLEGCDGFKTGYFTEAGFSIAATAQKKGQRAIAIVMGSEDRKVRDARAREILSKGLMQLVMNAPPQEPAAATATSTAAPSTAASQPAKEATQTSAKVQVTKAADTDKSDVIQIKKDTLKMVGAAVGCLILLIVIVSLIMKNRRPRSGYMG